MSLSRKHRSIKKSSKSSKRSKNFRSSKKTRKHMRKMRGGVNYKVGDRFILKNDKNNIKYRITFINKINGEIQLEDDDGKEVPVTEDILNAEYTYITMKNIYKEI